MSESRDCLFCRIVKGELPCTKVYEDTEVIAFKDINPAAPTHILVLPRQHIPCLADSSESDSALLGKLLLAVKRVAKEAGLSDYRVIINNGSGAGQTVFHLHIHLLGGKPMGERLI